MPKAYPAHPLVFVWHDDDFHGYYPIDAEQFAHISTDGTFATIRIDGKDVLYRFDDESVPAEAIAFVLLHSTPPHAFTPRLIAGLAARSEDDESQPGTVYLFH